MRQTIWLLALLCSSLMMGADTWLDTQQHPGPWKQVKKLQSEQKFEAASKEVDSILQSARQQKQVKDWTRALITRVQLRLSLHGYETAVEWLKEQPWPEDPIAKPVLHLFYAGALTQYFNQYQWEIRKRETVVSEKKLDLKKWSADQIATEINAAFAAAWKHRAELGKYDAAFFAPFIVKGNYPKNIRDSFRDALTYGWIAHLSNTSFWRPEHSNNKFALDLAKLIRGIEDDKLSDPETHPLQKLAYLSTDLEL